MIPVDIVMRSNYAQQFGGDVLQMQELLSRLPSGRFDARLVAAGKGLNLRRDALVHIVNIDRPWDFLEAVAATRRLKAPLLVSPIHHEHARAAAIQHARPVTARRVAEFLLPLGPLEYVKRLRRSGVPSVTPKFPAVLSYAALRRGVARALLSADAVLLLAQGEGDVIERDFGLTLTKRHVIPNGMPALSIQQPWSSRDIDVLVPGRIEPRKNQLALAEALSGRRTNATFVGAVNSGDSRYTKRFLETIRCSDNLTYHHPVPPAEMGELYGRARTVVNASYVEVLSLVDLEAYAAGCHLISTSAGHTREWLRDDAVFLEPGDCKPFVDAAERRRVEPPNQWLRDTVLQSLNWDLSASHLAGLYELFGAALH